jgi:hypothetical protein
MSEPRRTGPIPNPDLVAADAFEALQAAAPMSMPMWHESYLEPDADTRMYTAGDHFYSHAERCDLPARVRRLVGENERLRAALRCVANSSREENVRGFARTAANWQEETTA